MKIEKPRLLTPKEWNHIRELLSLEANYYINKINDFNKRPHKKYPKDWNTWCCMAENYNDLVNALSM